MLIENVVPTPAKDARAGAPSSVVVPKSWGGLAHPLQRIMTLRLPHPSRFSKCGGNQANVASATNHVRRARSSHLSWFLGIDEDGPRFPECIKTEATPLPKLR